MSEAGGEATPKGTRLGRIGIVLLSLWIFGLSLFFLVRFSFLVYSDQQAAIDGLLQSLRP